MFFHIIAEYSKVFCFGLKIYNYGLILSQFDALIFVKDWGLTHFAL